MIEYILEATVRYATPLLLVALGEIIAERAGVINIGLEGMMILGAVYRLARFILYPRYESWARTMARHPVRWIERGVLSQHLWGA